MAVPRKVTVSEDEDADGAADADGGPPSFEWEDVLPDAPAGAAAEEQAAGAPPATAPELLVWRASASDVQAHMARLPPKVSGLPS